MASAPDSPKRVPPPPDSSGIPPVDRPKSNFRFACEGCGADMVFDPVAGLLKCPYCGRTAAMPAAVGRIVERDMEAYLTPSASRLSRIAEDALEVQCSGCGSIVEFKPPEVAGSCPFCGAKIVAQPQAANPLIAPEGVLPFAIPEKTAREQLQAWIRSRPLAPNALKETARQGGFSGVYLPFWTYDSSTYSRYRGERGEYYWETEYYTNSKGERESRQVQKTRWYSASGAVSHFFDDVLVAATTSLPRNRLNELEPWDLAEVRPYEPAYLSGFKAQRYQIDLSGGFELAREVMASHIHQLVCADIGGDTQRVHSINTEYSNRTFKHLLLPVWVSAYRYERKLYQIMINARTGEVQGDRPWSIWKIAFLILVIGTILFFAIRWYMEHQN